MDNEQAKIELDLLADWLSLISSKIAANYDRARSGDAVLCDELSRSLVLCDTLTIKLRTASKLAMACRTFNEQEQNVLEMLEKSHKFIADRNGLKLVRNDVDGISYIGGEPA